MKRNRVDGGGGDIEEEAEIMVRRTHEERSRLELHHRLFNSIRYGNQFTYQWDRRHDNDGYFNIDARYYGPGTDPDDCIERQTWQTLLGAAIRHGNDKAFDCLVEEGVDLEKPCALEIVRVTSQGPVMALYRPLTYAVRHNKLPFVEKLLFTHHVNRTHAPTDVLHSRLVSPYDESVELLEKYDAWLGCMYALMWCTKYDYTLGSTPWRYLGAVLVAIVQEAGCEEWLKDVRCLRSRFF